MSNAIGGLAQMTGQIYAAKKQQETADKYLAEERRRRAPFDRTAGEVSKEFSKLQELIGDSPILNQAMSRMQQLIRPGALTTGLAEAGSEFVTDYLAGTQEAADIDRERLQRDLIARFGAQYGNRAGSDLTEAAGRAGAEFETRRHAGAQALQLPASQLIGNLRTTEAQLPLAYGQYGLNQILSPLALKANFGAQQASSPGAGGFSAASPLASGLIGAGSIMSSPATVDWWRNLRSRDEAANTTPPLWEPGSTGRSQM